jgi:hypothetical protein
MIWAMFAVESGLSEPMASPNGPAVIAKLTFEVDHARRAPAGGDA